MDDGKIEAEPGVKDYIIEEDDGKFVSLKARNEKLGLTMSVVPLMDGFGGRSDRELEVEFRRDNGKNVSNSGSVQIISTGQLLGMDDEAGPPLDADLVEETVGQRYVPIFQRVVGFADYDDLVDQVFPDSDTDVS